MARAPLSAPASRNRPLLNRKGVVTGGSPGGPARVRTGLNALKARVKVRGLAVIDKRTVAARHLLDWRAEVLADLGGAEDASAAQRALVEDAVRTRLYLDHVDAFLLEQSSLILKRRRLRGRLIPLVLERMKLADHLIAVLGRLGLERRGPKSLDLSDYLAQERPPALGGA